MIDFPNAPTDGQIFSATNGVVYKWSATYSSWLTQNPAPPLGGTGDFCAQLSSGAVPTALATVQPATVTSGNSGLWYNTANGRWTPPAGRYVLMGYMSCTNSGASQTAGYLRKNGTNIIPLTYSTIGTPNYSAELVLQANVDANGSDYFDMQVQAGAGTSYSSLVLSAFPLTGLLGPTGPAGGGKLLQTQSVETGAVATGTTVVPFDNTIPQQTEGNQFMSLAITPQSATSKLIIEVVWVGSNDLQSNLFACLFQDSAANALAVAVSTVAANGITTIAFCHVMTSGTTSATTFKLRVGGNGGGTCTFNGVSAGTQLVGGVLASSIVIREVLP